MVYVSSFSSIVVASIHRLYKTLHIGTVLVITCAIVYPVPFTHAGILSTFTGKVKAVFLSDQASSTNDSSSETSQTITLFKASISDEDSVKDAVPSSSESLSATTGPLRVSTEEVVYPSDDSISVYEVKKGDTLSVVASIFGVSKNTIMWANNLKSEKISPGDVLLILPVTGIRHTVKKGDTVASIAKKYKADVDDIATYNGITKSKELAIDDVLIVPDGEIVVTPTAKTTTKKPTIYATSVSGGYFARPLIGGIKTQSIHGNNAVDIAATPGTKVLASAEGKVLIARTGGYNGGYGNMIIISHSNGSQTLYAHLRSVDVVTGQNVAQGQGIGEVGSTGRSTGPHLHFEVRGAKNPF